MKILNTNYKSQIYNKNKPKKITSVDTLIYQELDELRYNTSHTGTKYLFDCIHYVYKNNLQTFNLKNDIYPEIAKKHCTTPVKVKADIFYAVQNSYCECEEYILNKYFNRTFLSAPKTKEIITQVIRHIKNTEDLS